MGIKIKFKEFGIPRKPPGNQRARKPWTIIYLLEQMGLELDIPEDQLKKYIASVHGGLIEELFIHLSKEARSKIVPLIVERGKKIRFYSRGFVPFFLDELSLEELETHLLDILDWVSFPINQHLLTALQRVQNEDVLRRVYHKKKNQEKIKTFILKKLSNASLGLTDPNEEIRETAKALVQGKKPRTINYENRIRKGIRGIMNTFIDLWGGEQIKQKYASYCLEYQSSAFSSKIRKIQWKHEKITQIKQDEICISFHVNISPGFLSGNNFLSFPDPPKNIKVQNIRNQHRVHISHFIFKKKDYKDFHNYIGKNLKIILEKIILESV